MKIDDAKALRAELEAIEATMMRIKALWRSPDYPSSDELKELAKTVQGISAFMDDIIVKAEQMPSADELSA
jgi:hypothetical protein